MFSSRALNCSLCEWRPVVSVRRRRELIWLSLVRAAALFFSDHLVSCSGCAEGYARDATEIQNIQIAEGDVCHGLPIPIYMVFPRLFTCPTLETTNFKVGQYVFVVVAGGGVCV